MAYAAWLSVHSSEGQRELAAKFVDYILRRAREEGNAVYEKAEEIVERGRAVGSLRLTDVKGREVDVGGRRHVVSVIGGGAQFDEGRGDKTLLRIKITAEVDGVGRDYTMTFGRYRAGQRDYRLRNSQGQRAWRQGGRRREVLSPHKGPDGKGAEGAPHEGRHNVIGM
ncbi:MAG: hypothetical protein AT715_02720 [Thermoproteus sp. JCHS_4]|nr:MAG: hypothetical protein AT715_02720 [Thermoproteus sp. JCHS_4]